MLKLGAVGCGNMASAILRGAARKMTGQFEFYGYDPDTAKTDALADIGLTALSSGEEVAKTCDYILIAVKPQFFPDAAVSLRAAAEKDKVYISIMAGITAASIKDALGFDAKICITMPNTPLMVGAGATAVAAVDPISREEFLVAKSLFESAGIVSEIPADKLSDVIPLNGSSPAFIYAFAKGFLRYGKEAGFSDEVSLSLFCQALRGAAEMLEHSGYDPDMLIKMVSSKGGTTVAGLTAFDEMDLQGMIDLCCERCVKRAYELAEGK